jgi:probable addiction module antidote protein
MFLASNQDHLFEFLKNPNQAAQYLNACLEEDDDPAFRKALRDVVEANAGMTAVARDSQLNRESLYRALSETGNPSLNTVATVLRALGLGFSMRPLDEVRVPRPTVRVNRVMAVGDLASWKRNTFLERKLFPETWGRIESARAGIKPDRLSVVSLTWEHALVKSGGVAAVGLRLGEALKNYRPRDTFAKGFPQVFRLSPLHRKLFPEKAFASLLQVTRTRVLFDGETIDLNVFRLSINDDEWYLFEDASQRFLQADGGRPRGTGIGTDPYFYSAETTREERDGLNSFLLRDVLFAAKAVPAVLAALGLTENLVVHAHDWTFALVALTIKQELAHHGGLLKSAVTVLSLHNPFDHVVRTPAENQLAKLAPGTPDERWAFPFEVRTGVRKVVPDTVLECALGLLDGPVALVSPGFAAEASGTRQSPRDPILRFHFAPHLASPLRYQGVVGIQNSNFYPEKEWALYRPELVDAVLVRGDASPILDEKRQRRNRLIKSLPPKPGPRLKVMGSLEPIGEDTVLFHMFGRFDPCQKGFDVFAHAITRYLEAHRDADVRFLLTPLINGLEPDAFYQQLDTLANSPGSIAVGRVLVTDGFLEAIKQVQAGVCWSVWPSFYEPCGSGTEPFAMGTPVIARAVGGLPRQLVHEESGDYCGLLYRENVPAEVDDRTSWPEIENAKSPSERLNSKLYNAMTDALVAKIGEAVDIRRNQPEKYARMLARTTQQVQDPFFSAERFADDYWALYHQALTLATDGVKRASL